MPTSDTGGTGGIDRRRYLQTAGLVATSGALAGCSGLLDGASGEPTDTPAPTTGTTVEGSADPVRVGIDIPFTGFMSEEGPEVALGIEFWRQQVNAAGGLLGRPVEFVIYDGGSTRAGAKAVYQRLLDEDNVDLVLGASGTLATAGAIEVLEDRGMPCVFPMAWGPLAWDRDREWTLPFLPVATEAPRGLVEVLASLDVETFGMLKSSSGYVRDGAAGLEEFLADAGIDIVENVTYERYNGEERRAALEQVAASEADVIGPGGSVAEVKPLIRAIADRGVEADTFSWFDFDDTRLVELADIAEGMLGLGMWAAEIDYPDNDAFISEFLPWASKRRVDWSRVKLLQHHSPAAYSGAVVLQRAVERAGSFDPAAVRDALWDLETGTPFGTFAVDDEGYQVGKEMFVIQYQQRMREIVWPPEYRTAEPTLTPINHA